MIRNKSDRHGRFLQPDPLGYIDSLNLYEYVGNAPLFYLDPYGLLSVDHKLKTAYYIGLGGSLSSNIIYTSEDCCYCGTTLMGGKYSIDIISTARLGIGGSLAWGGFNFSFLWEGPGIERTSSWNIKNRECGGPPVFISRCEEFGARGAPGEFKFGAGPVSIKFDLKGDFKARICLKSDVSSFSPQENTITIYLTMEGKAEIDWVFEGRIWNFRTFSKRGDESIEWKELFRTALWSWTRPSRLCR